MSHIVERITARYQEDMASNFIAVTADDLPLSYESISDEWLTNVLCRNVPGARVVQHRKAVRDDGSSNRIKIQVSYNDAGQEAGLPGALFCKASHDLPNRIVLGISGGANSEVLFYSRVRPLLPIEAPVSYHANCCPDSHNSIIMLGDLSETVSEFCSHRTVMTRARAESQMRLLSSLHGHAYSNADIRAAIATLPTWGQFFANTLAFGMREGSTQGFLDGHEVIPPRLFARRDDIWDATVKSVAAHAGLPETLTHADVHLKNWYVAGNGEMGLSDWQCCNRGSWARDFAYTISTALTVEDRRAWEQELLKLYLQGLAQAGGPELDFAQAWTQYRQQLVTALTWWTVTLSPPPGMPDMQPRDITLEFIRRISTAMDDVDSLGAF